MVVSKSGQTPAAAAARLSGQVTQQCPGKWPGSHQHCQPRRDLRGRQPCGRGDTSGWKHKRLPSEANSPWLPEGCVQVPGRLINDSDPVMRSGFPWQHSMPATGGGSPSLHICQGNTGTLAPARHHPRPGCCLTSHSVHLSVPPSPAQTCCACKDENWLGN